MSTETPPSSDTNASASAPSGGDSTAAILSYIPVIGFVIALILHNGKKTELGSYHLRQSLGLHLSFLIYPALVVVFLILGVIPLVNIVFGAIAVVLFPLLLLAFFAFFVLGLIYAAQGQQKPLPLVGDRYQSWFANAFV